MQQNSAGMIGASYPTGVIRASIRNANYVTNARTIQSEVTEKLTGHGYVRPADTHRAKYARNHVQSRLDIDCRCGHAINARSAQYSALDDSISLNERKKKYSSTQFYVAVADTALQ